MPARSSVIVFVLFMLFALSACAAGPGTSGTPATFQPPVGSPTATVLEPTPTGAIDWAALDVCSLLDETDVQEITGESAVGFTDQGHQEANGGKCFWGATRAGFPAYVEIGVWRNTGTMPEYSGGTVGQKCSESPVNGVGTEAIGGICAPPPQRKVYLSAIGEGVWVTFLVNEPTRPLEPDDLAAYVNTFLQLNK